MSAQANASATNLRESPDPAAFGSCWAPPKAADTTPEVSDVLTALPWWAARGLLYVIVGFVTIALVWAHLSRISIVVEARGTLLTDSYVRPVQATANGIVQAVHVREGSTVSRGQMLAQLKSETTAVDGALAQTIITAPGAGVITRLNVRGPGDVVRAGELLATIAPAGARLIVQAEVSNKDMALVKKGLPVKLKFDAFPFQDYGSVTGKIVEIAPNAQVDERIGSFYKVVIVAEQTSIIAKGKSFPLRPGLTLTAEIITERKSILAIILEPIRKLNAEMKSAG